MRLATAGRCSSLMSYDGVTVGGSVDAVPELIAKIFDRKGAAGTDFRSFRNNLDLPRGR